MASEESIDEALVNDASAKVQITKRQTDEEQDQDSHPPSHAEQGMTPTDLKKQPIIAGPWRWFLLASCVYVAITLVSVATCFGVLFGDFLITRNVSSTNTAWILNIYLFCWWFCSMFSGPICKHFSWRRTGLTFSIIISIAFTSLAFAKSVWQIVIMFSIVCGSFGGMTGIIIINALPHYFPDKMGMATSVYLGGIACGQVILPLLSRSLQDAYGYSGATLILGGLILNICVAFTMMIVPKKNINNSQTLNADPLLERTELSSSSNDEKSISHSNHSFCHVYASIAKDIFKNIIKNAKCIKHPVLLICATSMATMIIGFVNFLGLVPFALINEGYNKRVASLALSATGAGNILTRIVMIFISDKKWLNRRKLFIAGLVGINICACIIPLVLHIEALVFTLMVGYGMSVAVANSLYMVIIIDTLGMKLYEAGIAASCLLVSFLCLIVGPLTGFIRDKTSSYKASMYACEFILLISLLVWMFLPAATRRAAANASTTDPPVANNSS